MTNATLRTEKTPLGDLLAETGLDWVLEGSRISARLSAGRIVAERQGESVAFHIEISRPAHASLASLAAIADFIGALNRRLRYARSSLVGDNIIFEATTSPAAFTAVEIRKAVERLSAAASVARKEFAALLDEAVAQHYLNFHEKGVRYDNTNSPNH